jgi:hypothetical protein
MIFKKRFDVAKVLIFICMVICVNVKGFPYLIQNETEGGFGGEGDGATTASVSGLEYHIVEGAGHYLASYANALLFMQKTELTETRGLNLEELKDYIDKALESMTRANSNYFSLKQLADDTPYNMAVNEALKSFDYDAFKEENGLRTDMFDLVKKYLKKGDIRGNYGEVVTRTAELREILAALKAQVDAGLFPKISDVWKLNQAYTDTFLFGQYVAQVFDRVLEE